mmetsp:Transcript_11947/g.13606  ORF Transcript_11947/g.13606 Transcript_11947/m.13606 type:complete len:115 (-) Transcript_11947:110-454(-)
MGACVSIVIGPLADGQFRGRHFGGGIAGAEDDRYTPLFAGISQDEYAAARLIVVSAQIDQYEVARIDEFLSSAIAAKFNYKHKVKQSHGRINLAKLETATTAEQFEACVTNSGI